jgi:NADH-quinone oxidoreductase subunit M
VTAQTTTSLVLVATPVLAALLGLLLWGKPEGLKDWLLIATGLSLGTLAWRAETLPMQSGGLFLLSLLPLMAFVTLLGQPLHASNAAPSVLTLLLAGLGLGVLASEGPVSLIFFFFLLAAVGVILFYYRHRTSSDAWWGIGTLCLGLFGVGVALTAVPPVSSIALVIACATGLPLVPFHKGYVAALKGLPGNLPAFVALLLPVIGFHGILTALAQLPSTVTEVLGILALMGMLYGSLKALNQSRAALVVAYGSVAFLSILWWCLVTTQATAPQTVVYLSAVSLATGGLLLAWYMLEARYGEIGLGALSGLALPMPRFAMAVSLLALAALGLPPFGVFSGFMGLLLAPLVKWSGGLIIMIVAWLCASWYLFDLVQRLLWGCQSTDRRHEDLRDSELASLAIVLLLLVALGVMPSRLFNLGPMNLEPTVVMEFLAWTE